MLNSLTENRLASWQRLLLTTLACGATALVATPLHDVLDPANIVMLFLLVVLLVAVSLGRGAAVYAAFLSVAMFDFFFVPPRFSLIVHDGQYLVTFAVMLAAGLIAGQLMANLRHQAEEASRRERQTRALYEMARDLAGALTLDQVEAITRQFLKEGVGADAVILLPDADEHLSPLPGENPPPFNTEKHLARMAYATSSTAECDDLAGTGYATAYFPLRAPTRMRGVIAIAPTAASRDQLIAQRPLLEAMASLVAIAIERLHYAEIAQSSQVDMVSERLRSSILSALSHDLRTPLTALVGMADSLTFTRPPLPPDAQESATAIREQATRLAGLVGNLLDMARLHAGKVTLRKEWQPIEEVVGSSIKLLGTALAEHPVRTALASDLPLVEFDAVLIERVFCNLLENAAKYSAPGQPVDIAAVVAGDMLQVSIRDHGPGFPAQAGSAVFDMFVRGEAESSKSGVGLGLAICRAIVEAHGGSIAASNAGDGGGIVTFTLPAGTPPTIEAEPQEARP